jgi:hypothetical protein
MAVDAMQSFIVRVAGIRDNQDTIFYDWIHRTYRTATINEVAMSDFTTKIDNTGASGI